MSSSLNLQDTGQLFELESLLPWVEKPSRYIGGEWNSIVKPKPIRGEAVSICLCFPDLYETGFANAGVEILYAILNARADAFAERAYAVAPDMAQLLRKKMLPLFSLETKTPLKDFDLVGFALPYELCYTNILEMLDLAQIPLRTKARDQSFPLLIAGGPCAVNPEPLAEFFDAIVIGDGEEIIGEIIQTVKNAKEKKFSKEELLFSLAQIEGLYVPSLYTVSYLSDGTVDKVVPKLKGMPERIAYRRFSLESEALGLSSSFPTAPVVPYVATVHDRLNVEIQRGCPWRCRFCQAGFSYRPYRERSAEELFQLIEKGLQNTGYDAVTLAGLSSADHTEIVPLLYTLAEKLSPRRISVGLPSTRADRFNLALAELLSVVRRQSITFAPEAGTERLRRVIRKELSEAEIRQTLALAAKHGWKNVKLYFMYGLPTEREEDLQGMVELVRASKKENPSLSLTLTLSPFVPKPHTPYQWSAQERIETLREKLSYLKKNLAAKIRAHSLEQTVVEGVFSRGDRRCAELLECAWRGGAQFDGWNEKFQFEIWQKAFEQTGLSPEFYCYRVRAESEVFPWDHICGGPEKRVLLADYQTALKQATEPLPAPHLKERPPVPPPPKIRIPLAPTVQRIRVQLARAGAVRFLSHLEQIEMIRRMLRRTQLPLAYTSGFHPQIKCAFGPAISVGYESDCEYFDLDLTQRVELSSAAAKISAQLPNGFSLIKVSRIPLFFPSLENSVHRVDYTLKVNEEYLPTLDETAMKEKIQIFLSGNPVLEKKKKTKDGNFRMVTLPLLPLVLSMEWKADQPPAFQLALKLMPGKNVKPEKIVALFLNVPEERACEFLVRRVSLSMEQPDGTWKQP